MKFIFQPFIFYSFILLLSLFDERILPVEHISLLLNYYKCLLLSSKWVEFIYFFSFASSKQFKSHPSSNFSIFVSQKFHFKSQFIQRKVSLKTTKHVFLDLRWPSRLCLIQQPSKIAWFNDQVNFAWFNNQAKYAWFGLYFWIFLILNGILLDKYV